MKSSDSLVTAVRGSDRSDTADFFELANLFPKHTGFLFVVWISYKGGAQHDVRVKVSPGPKATREGMASVAIRPNVRVVEGDMSAGDLALLTKWIELNRGVLLKYWEGEIDTKDALDSMRVAE